MFPQFLSKALVPFFTKLLMKKHLNIMEKYFKMFTNLFFLLFFLIGSTIILTKGFWFSLLDSDIQLSWFSLLTLTLSIYLLGGSFIGSLYSAIDKPHISSMSSLSSALIASICLFKVDLGMSIIESGLLFFLISYGLNQIFLFGLLVIGFGYKLDFRKNIVELVFLVVLGYLVSENFCCATRDNFYYFLVCLGILVSYIITLSKMNVLDRFTQKEYRKFIATMRR
jgi:hypothetical protein